MVTILTKRDWGPFTNIRWKIISTYVIIITIVLTILSAFLVNTLYTCLFEQKKVEVLTSANIIASTLSESFTEEYITTKIPQLPLEKNSRTIIVDTKSTVIYDSYEETSLRGKIFINSAITEALKKNGKDSGNYYNENGKWFIDAAVPVIKNASSIGAVFIIVSGDSTEQVINNIRNSFLALGFLLLLFVSAFSTALARILTRPLEKLTGFINNMPTDSLSKVEVTTKDEVGQLALAFNALIDRLAELEDKRRAFVSDASHELKTPLSIIKLLSDSLIQTENPDPEFIREFLQDMNNEVERLTRIIERLLNLTKMDSKQLRMQLIPTDIKEVLGEIYKKLSPLAERKNINFTLLTNTEDVFLPMERDSLTEAIYNIADNSIKYTEDGGTVTIELSRDLGNVFVAISDTGIGIPKEEAQKIFDRFYRVDKARARDTGGTGLGLAIALDAVKLHGGFIEVSSEEGEGSKFTIVLPYDEMKDDK
ncbi:MAG: HAMP domain-containing protein [Clostridia bacterium]|nr:HAMP domain-containing protein [Clostridia bacterium]